MLTPQGMLPEVIISYQGCIDNATVRLQVNTFMPVDQIYRSHAVSSYFCPDADVAVICKCILAEIMYKSFALGLVVEVGSPK